MHDALLRGAISAVERRYLPDFAIRAGVRRLCRDRARSLPQSAAEIESHEAAFVAACDALPVAIAVDEANRQHYELPPEFFDAVLGPHRKYSCCSFPDGVADLGRAEEIALNEVCDRALLRDGLTILELGCGWGSLSLFMARRFPDARITAVSNSASQRASIIARAKARNLSNLNVITADMNAFDTQDRFDRIVSIEMFEHMSNWRALLTRCARWLAPGGRMFLHTFCHAFASYRFETRGEDNWMGRYFFTGGMMPSASLIDRYADLLLVEDRWVVGGSHYQKTADAWLARMDDRRRDLMPVLASVYGRSEAPIWFQRWRIFFMACAELFGMNGGRDWFVSHCRLRHPD